MSGKIMLALVVLALMGAALAGDQRAEHMSLLHAAKANPRHHFTEWVHKFEKAYKAEVEEFEKRLEVWRDNLEFVLEYNSKHTSHWLGLNSLADRTHAEYKQHFLGYKPSLRDSSNRIRKPTGFRYANTPEEAVPPSVDWRQSNAVTEVKNQGQCGSCWAFSAIGAVEGINAIVTNSMVSLSEQELVDCDQTEDQGCSGGLMDYAFEFIKDNGGIDTEEDYPYQGIDEKCETRRKHRKVVTIDGYEDVPGFNENALKKAVAHQPVSVAIEADQRSFQLYAGGVYDGDDCGTSLDHGVLAVGYVTVNVTDDDDDEHKRSHPYWIVKNSWGADWGEEGYIRLRLGVSDDAGQCGIAMVPSYPVKTGPNPPAPPPTPSPSPKPHPPKPQPVTCDDYNECPPDTTCCCLDEYMGMCLSYGCCPMPDAVCCDDHTHCCPSTLPVCDTYAGRCLPKMGSIEGSIPWATKTPATPTGHASLGRKGIRKVIKTLAPQPAS